MAIIKFIRPGKSAAALGNVINYIINPEKTIPDLIGGHNCFPDHVFEQFMATKNTWDKSVINTKQAPTSGRQYLHFTHAFGDTEHVPPEVAKEIADRLLQHSDFNGFQVFYAVHTDRVHTHTHFIVNSVNMETGRKWQQSKKQLDALKAYSNQLCREYGLKECPKHWKSLLFASVQTSLVYSRSWEEFFADLQEKGYGAKFTGEKYITFTDPNGRSCRNNKLYPPERFTKEAMEAQFKQNFLRYGNASRDDIQRRLEQLAIQRRQDAVDANVGQTVTALLSTAKQLLRDDTSQANGHTHHGKLEGQALKDKRKETEFGEGYDWGQEI